MEKILFPEKRKTCKEVLGQGGSTSGPTLAPDVTNNEPSSTVAIASDLLTFGENDEKKPRIATINCTKATIVSSKPKLLTGI